MVVSPVNEITPEGLPEFFASDIRRTALLSPRQSSGDLLWRKNRQYVVVNTRTPELTFRGDTNATTFIRDRRRQLSDIFKRITLPCVLGLRSCSYPTISPAKVASCFTEHPRTRNKIAPFLKYDLILIWLWRMRSCTGFRMLIPPRIASRMYSRYGDGGTIMQPVKVTVDAYNGDVNLRLGLERADIGRCIRHLRWSVQTSDAMPEALRSHLRYPEDLLTCKPRCTPVSYDECILQPGRCLSLPCPTDNQTFEPFI